MVIPWQPSAAVRTAARPSNHCEACHLACAHVPTNYEACELNTYVLSCHSWDKCGSLVKATAIAGSDQLDRFYPTCMTALYPAGTCGSTCDASTLTCRATEVERACCASTNNCPVGSHSPHIISESMAPCQLKKPIACQHRRLLTPLRAPCCRRRGLFLFLAPSSVPWCFRAF